MENFHSKFQNSVILSKVGVKLSKVNQAIYSSAPTSILNMKTLAQILFEISCTQGFQILLSKGHNSEEGHNSDMKKIRVTYFVMRNVHMKFQNPSILRSKVSTDKPKAIYPSNFFKVGGIKIPLVPMVQMLPTNGSIGRTPNTRNIFLFYLTECKTAFGLYDRDGDGYVTTTDLGSALRSMGIFPTDNELMDILNEQDPEGEL